MINKVNRNYKLIYYKRNIKFLKWWVQSYLIGIETIKVGLRTESGIVKKIIDFDINQIVSQSNKRVS